MSYRMAEKPKRDEINNSPYKDQTMPDEQWFENLTAYAKLGSEQFDDQIDLNEAKEALDKAETSDPDSQIAPGMMMNDPLEEQATPNEISSGDSTEVTRLYLDRTPRD